MKIMPINKNELIIIVPAREGSKRLKNKNRKVVGSSSLLKRTLETIKSMNLLSRTLFTSDDPILVDEAKAFGSVKVCIRPKQLAEDNSTSLEVVKHALEYSLSNFRWTPSILIYLQLTSPFRDHQRILSCLEKLYYNDNIDAIVSGIATVEFSEKTIGYAKNLLLKNMGFSPETLVNADGNFYIVKIKPLLSQKSFFPKNTKVSISDFKSSLDIDTEADLRLAHSYSEV